jgi:hypothetical protein
MLSRKTSTETVFIGDIKRPFHVVILIMMNIKQIRTLRPIEKEFEQKNKKI